MEVEVDYDPEEILLFWIFEAFIKQSKIPDEKYEMKVTLTHLEHKGTLFTLEAGDRDAWNIVKMIEFSKTSEFLDSLSLNEQCCFGNKFPLIVDFIEKFKNISESD